MLLLRKSCHFLVKLIMLLTCNIGYKQCNSVSFDQDDENATQIGIDETDEWTQVYLIFKFSFVFEVFLIFLSCNSD